MSNNAILILDADRSWVSLLASGLGRSGLAVDHAGDGVAAAELARQTTYPVAFIEPGLPGCSGLEAVRALRAVSPDTRIIVLTGRPTPDSMMEAVREHLFDYLCKPIDLQTVEAAARRALEDYHQAFPPAPAAWPSLPGASRARDGQAVLVGQSRAMELVREQIAEVTPTNMTVLIRGESGTGKGVVARLIHESSLRGGRGTLVKINCPAIPETLLESELFGHEAGAFTDAKGRKPGRFEMAHGGTIFLDEIGEIPPHIQVKLLQVIEHKEFQRIGGSGTIRLDARIVAATNASLEGMIGEGAFRADLFYRLNEYCIYLPPLRERVEDIPLLVEHFLSLYGEEFGRPRLSLSAEMMALMMRCPWHGNVRELESVVRRFALTGREESIRSLLKPAGEARPAATRQASGETLRQTEIQTIMSALTQARWNQRRAAGLLGISYSALRRRIDKYGLKMASAPRVIQPVSFMPECRF